MERGNPPRWACLIDIASRINESFVQNSSTNAAMPPRRRSKCVIRRTSNCLKSDLPGPCPATVLDQIESPHDRIRHRPDTVFCEPCIASINLPVPSAKSVYFSKAVYFPSAPGIEPFLRPLLALPFSLLYIYSATLLFEFHSTIAQVVKTFAPLSRSRTVKRANHEIAP